MRYPSNNPIVQGFGYKKGYPLNNGFHRGVDFAYDPNDPYVYMPEDGIVICVPNNGDDGNGIYVRVGDRLHGLCHNDRFLVPSSSFQREGTRIGIIGSTGFVQPPGEPGRHCHWAVKVGNDFIDGTSLVSGGKGAGNNQGEDMLDRQTVNEIWVGFTGIEANETDYNTWVGRPTNELIHYHAGGSDQRREYLKKLALDESTIKALYTATLHRDPESEDAWKHWVGHVAIDFLNQVVASDEWKRQNHILLKAYPDLAGQAGNTPVTPRQAAALNLLDSLETALNTK